MPGSVSVACSIDSTAISSSRLNAERERRDHAEQQVVGAHEDGDRAEAVDHAVEALGDVLRAEARADRAFLDDLHRRGERTGAQQQRGVVGLGGVMRPEIWKRLPSSPRITGAVTTSPLPFSNSRIAIRLPMFSRETSLHDARAARVDREVHRRLLALAVEAGLRVGKVLAGDEHLALDHQRRAAALGVPLVAERHRSGAALGRRASALSSTMRISSVAVRPMMSFAFAVSCTPGSWTTTRSAPCCWITGSATPSSLTRLCSVVMFCVMAAVCTRLVGVRLEGAHELPVGAVLALDPVEVGELVLQQRCAPRPASPGRGSGRRRRSPSRVMPVWRMFLSRSSVRTSPASRRPSW